MTVAPAEGHVPGPAQAAATSPLLDVRNLHTAFPAAGGAALAAAGVSFSVGEGETRGIVGESGSGKSVTLRSLLGLVPEPGRVIDGQVLWKGRDLLALRPSELLAIRGREISMIFQDPTSSLNPVFTIGEQIAETLRVKLDMGGRSARARAAELLDHVGIPAARERLRSYPHELSGGMRQRVMIAIAIACRPQLLLADEPTTALDVTIQDQILALLGDLQDEFGMAMILVSHDLGIVAQNCDAVTVMYAGHVVEDAPTAELFRAPSHPYTIGLLRAIPSTREPGTRRRLEQISGQPPDLSRLPDGCPFRPRCSHARDACATVTMELESAGAGHGTACPFFAEIR
jgi:oligopeptide/dipeptide ABC transporter ATP-binding protein